MDNNSMVKSYKLFLYENKRRMPTFTISIQYNTQSPSQQENEVEGI